MHPATGQRMSSYPSPRVTQWSGSCRQYVPWSPRRPGAGGEASPQLQDTADMGPSCEQKVALYFCLLQQSCLDTCPKTWSSWTLHVFSGKSPPNTGTQKPDTSQQAGHPKGWAFRGAEHPQFPTARSMEQMRTPRAPSSPQVSPRASLGAGCDELLREKGLQEPPDSSRHQPGGPFAAPQGERSLGSALQADQIKMKIS